MAESNTATHASVHPPFGENQTATLVGYSFTSLPIAKALAAAKKRGVALEAILDRSQRTEKYSAADFVAHAELARRDADELSV